MVVEPELEYSYQLSLTDSKENLVVSSSSQGRPQEHWIILGSCSARACTGIQRDMRCDNCEMPNVITDRTALRFLCGDVDFETHPSALEDP